MAVKVRRERPDLRRHHRVTAPLFVVYAGRKVRAADWSLGGLRVEGAEGAVPEAGSDVRLQLTLPFQGFDVTFEVGAHVVRASADTGMFAVRFTDIGDRERELMSHFLEELVRGSMVDVEDTIQRIDVPVTPASLQPDTNPIKQLPVSRWPAKAVIMTAFYAVLGLVIFGYAGVLAYSNFFRLEVQTAVITAPIETVSAQADGFVKWKDVKPGDTVKSGDVILSLIDSQLQREIELADIAVQERKAKLSNLKQRHLDELEKIRAYATVEMKNIRQTKAELEGIESKLNYAARSEQRLRTLHEKGFTTDSKLEEASREVTTLRKEMEIRRIELAARIELSEQNVGKRMYTGNETIGSGDLQGKAAELEADIRLAENEIRLAQQRYMSNLAYRERQAVRAPFDGTVLELPRFDNGTVRRGDVIAIIEQREARQITAYLNQDEVLRIGLGDSAQVYIPAVRETVEATVARIDRTSGFIQEANRAQSPGYRWRGPVDRSAKVTLTFKNPERVRDVGRYRSGLPVTVVFKQHSRSNLFSMFDGGSASGS